MQFNNSGTNGTLAAETTVSASPRPRTAGLRPAFAEVPAGGTPAVRRQRTPPTRRTSALRQHPIDHLAAQAEIIGRVEELR
jgi:hypothetical protein